MEPLLPIFFGWLLGVLQPIATEPVTNWKRRRAVRQALNQELQELRYRMTLLAYRLELRYGAFDRAFVEWAQPMMVNYENSNPRAERISKGITRLLTLPDEQIALYAKTESDPEVPGVFMPRVEAPYLEHTLEEVQLFSPRCKKPSSAFARAASAGKQIAHGARTVADKIGAFLALK